MKTRIGASAAILLLAISFLVWLCASPSDRSSGEAKAEALGASGGDTTGGRKEVVDKPSIPWGDEVAGLRIALMFPRTTFAVTESVPCTLVIQKVGEATGLTGALSTQVYLHPLGVSPDHGPDQGLNTNLKLNASGRLPPYIVMKDVGAVCGFRIADVTQLCDLSLEGRYLFKVSASVEEVPAERGKESLDHVVESKPTQIEIRSFAEYPLVELPVPIPGHLFTNFRDCEQGRSVDGVRLGLMFARRCFDVTQPVSCDLILINAAETPRALPCGRSLAQTLDLELSEIYSEGRRPAERTARGRTLFEASARGRMRVAAKLYEPNEGYRLTICALNRFFDMTRPGTYELRVTVVVPELATGRPVRVTSNIARAEVQFSHQASIVWGQIVRILEDVEIEDLLGVQEKPK